MVATTARRESPPESVFEKQPKSLPARAAIHAKREIPENNFIAKIRDSESAKSILRGLKRFMRVVGACASFDAAMQDTSTAQWFFEISRQCADGFRAHVARRGTRATLLLRSARAARRALCVNTSLSGKLFFSTCWCNPNAVHFDSRVHAAIKPSH
ncbi:MAG TPA: hypothetical protein VGC86_02110 [Afipia sp.]